MKDENVHVLSCDEMLDFERKRAEVRRQAKAAEMEDAKAALLPIFDQVLAHLVKQAERPRKSRDEGEYLWLEVFTSRLPGSTVDEAAQVADAARQAYQERFQND